MSEMRKLLKIMESVPPVIANVPANKGFERDATVVINPRAGGGVGRFMEFTTEDSAMIDIKGVAREFAKDDFSMPERDLQNGNDWFHMSVQPESMGTSNDKPEFRPGDMVKIADVYGTVIGPGFGTFIGYGTTGEDCIVLFDGKQIVVPVENVASVLEQDAKDNFDEMDNDGNLSPMSFGSENVKIEQPANGGMTSKEPAMDQRDEFSSWMKSVEEALTVDEDSLITENPPEANQCGCGRWSCQTCFPEPDAQEPVDGLGLGDPMGAVVVGGNDFAPMDELPADEMEFEVGMEEDDDAVAAFKANGGQVQQLPYMNRPRNPGSSFGSKHIGSATGQGNRSQQRGAGANVAVGQTPSTKPVVGEDEMEMDQVAEKPKSGRGVKLGDIVQNTTVVPTGGQQSPMTNGGDNLDEGPDDMDFDPDYDAQEELEMGSPLSRQDARDEMEQIDPDEAMDMISVIKYMQDMGLSNSQRPYSEQELAGMNAPQLRKVHQEVTGDMDEAAKPTKTRSTSHLDDIDDILNPAQSHPIANIDEPAGMDDEPEQGGMGALPRAGADATRRATAGMTPSDTMRDYMNRINPEAGAGEPDLDPTAQNAVAVRTATDVPAVISNAMQASGVQTPNWHSVSDLPGFGQRNIRGMGRNVFSMFTSTPLEDLLTIANVDGQGPNTDAEMRAVAGWLRDNAQDLGKVELSHGQAIPGYKPDVKEYSINGVRFHVVRDPMGQYIYAYPDADARTPNIAGGGAGQGQLPGGNVPRLREEIAHLILKPTLMERIKWDEEIREIFKQVALTESVNEEIIDESTLSRTLGKRPGGQNLVKWMHRRHKLSNDAGLTPASFNERLFWKQFKSGPDNFVIVSAENGVAGIKPDEKFIKNRTAEFQKKGKTYNPGGDSTLPYQIVAFTDDGQQINPELLRAPAEDGEDYRDPTDPTTMRARMGKHNGKDIQNPTNVFNLLADQIGPLKTVWISGYENEKDAPAGPGSVERDKMSKRADMKKGATLDPQQGVQQIFKRVRPVLKKLADQAYSQITRSAQRAMNGGNLEGAQKIMGSGVKLKQFLVSLDTGKDINIDTGYGSPTQAFSKAIVKSIEKASGGPQGSDEFNHWLENAAKGNATALKPVLDGLRDTLVALT